MSSPTNTNVNIIATNQQQQQHQQQLLLPPANLDDPANVRRWLQTYHPKQLALLDNFEISLRLGRFSSRGCENTTNSTNSGSSSSTNNSGTYQYGRERRLITTRTVDLLRPLLVQLNGVRLHSC